LEAAVVDRPAHDGPAQRSIALRLLWQLGGEESPRVNSANSSDPPAGQEYQQFAEALSPRIVEPISTFYAAQPEKERSSAVKNRLIALAALSHAGDDGHAAGRSTWR
jgi:hypothetical protein